MSTTPTELGRYRLLRELGRGAMGVVWQAADPLLDRTVAIKTILLSGDPAERAAYEARFFQEARAAGRLSHPAIITIHDVGRQGDLAYMAMEMLQGQDLRERLAQGLPPLPEALALAAQVAQGLGFAHEHGVVHRDIKPANIMLLPGGRAKIMDFGIARLQRSDVKTQTGVLLGTPKYMSPEQIAGHAVDARSDIFSLGAVLYEMLVGRAPFSGADTAQLMYAIATARHAAPSRINSAVPAMLDLIVARALEKEPGARYQAAGELAADLQSCLGQLPAATRDRSLDRTEPIVVAGTIPADGTERLGAPGTAARPARTAGRELTRGISALRQDEGAWPFARRFDSSAALARLVASQHAPEPAAAPGLLARILRDRDLHRAALLGLGGALAGAALALF